MTEKKDFSVEIAKTSKELTPAQVYKLQELSSVVKLDEATANGKVTVNPDYDAVLNIHNEKADHKDYVKYVIVDKDGTMYVTGSEAFWKGYQRICEALKGEEFAINVYQLPSKNYPGKHFIACSVK